MTTPTLNPIPQGTTPAVLQTNQLFTVAFRTYFNQLDTFVRALLSSLTTAQSNISSLQTATALTEKYYLTTPFKVATLPAAGVQGRRAWVTDASSPTYGGTLTGSGTSIVPVFDTGSTWISA